MGCISSKKLFGMRIAPNEIEKNGSEPTIIGGRYKIQGEALAAGAFGSEYYLRGDPPKFLEFYPP